jgi:large subunit ribosomal protein L9
MKVILTENIPKLGEVGDVCSVADGYARNFLLPQGFAIVATDGTLRQVSNLKRQETRRRDRVRADAETVKKSLEQVTLTFEAKVGETGRLYGSITSSDIADRIEQVTGNEIDRRKIVLDNPLRQLGQYAVPVRLLPDLTADLVVVVEPEEEEELPEEVRAALEEEGILQDVEEIEGLEGEDVADTDTTVEDTTVEGTAAEEAAPA